MRTQQPRAVQRRPSDAGTSHSIIEKEKVMRRHAIPITMSVLTLAIILLPGSLFAQDTRGVTGAGKATLPAGASLSGVSVSGLQFGLGAVIPGDGTAAGSLQATLA